MNQEKLKELKYLHENWVKNTLERDVTAFANDKLNIKSLPKIKTGKQIVDMINGSDMFDLNHDELNTEEEATERPPAKRPPKPRLDICQGARKLDECNQFCKPKSR